MGDNDFVDTIKDRGHSFKVDFCATISLAKLEHPAFSTKRFQQHQIAISM